jgi:hypothetical protein
MAKQQEAEKAALNMSQKRARELLPARGEETQFRKSLGKILETAKKQIDDPYYKRPNTPGGRVTRKHRKSKRNTRRRKIRGRRTTRGRR